MEVRTQAANAAVFHHDGDVLARSRARAVNEGRAGERDYLRRSLPSEQKAKNGDCPFHLPDSDQLPPAETNSGPDDQIDHARNGAHLPPRPERHVSVGVEYRA